MIIQQWSPVVHLIMDNEKHSEQYKAGFTEGFHTVKGHEHLLEILLKVIGKIDAFYHSIETSEDTENLFILICEELNLLQEIIAEDFQ